MGAIVSAGVTAVLFLAAVAVHKAGHAAALRDLGIGRAVVRYGLPLRPRFTRQPTPERPWAVVVTPWLVTWHVTPAITTGEVDALPYSDAALLTTGGVIASGAAGCGLLAVWSFFTGALLPAGVWAAAAGLGWAGRRYVAPVLVPASPMVLLGAEVWALAGGLHTGGGLAGGRSFTGWLFTAAVASLTVALFTLLPLPQTDGGQIMSLAFSRWLRGRSAGLYARASSWVIVAAIAVAVLGAVRGVLG